MYDEREQCQTSSPVYFRVVKSQKETVQQEGILGIIQLL